MAEGHPDKVCDLIADSILDAYLERDPRTRVACEVLCKSGTVVLAGEIRSPERVDHLQVVRQAIREIGYTDPAERFNADGVQIFEFVTGQSWEIGAGVDHAADDEKEQGAGDQGIMFGYACDETPELMPATLQYSHNILSKLAAVRHSGEAKGLEPDAKSQVTLLYQDGRPVEVLQIVVSTQHAPKIGENTASSKRILELIKPYVLGVFPDGLVTKKTKCCLLYTSPSPRD